MSKSKENTEPKSVRHQRILELAAENPDASYRELADEIPSATEQLIKRVLEKHGDPADDEDNEQTPVDAAAEAYPDLDDLTAKERETLRVIHEHPAATQQEIADKLDVATATISNRVNGVEGFDWQAREQFTAAIFDDHDEDRETGETDSPEAQSGTEMTDSSSAQPGADQDDPANEQSVEEAPPAGGAQDADPSGGGPDSEDALAQLTERVAALETAVESLTQQPNAGAALSDPELAHKVVHACMESDAISEDEELAILRALIAD